MAPPPRIRSISRESVPGAPAWMDPIFQILNEMFGQVSSMFAKRLTRTENLAGNQKSNIAFTTPASGNPSVPVKWEMSSQPQHVVVSRLATADGSAIADAWSCTWKLLPDSQIQLTFQGLSVSTSYLCSILYE